MLSLNQNTYQVRIHDESTVIIIRKYIGKSSERVKKQVVGGLIVYKVGRGKTKEAEVDTSITEADGGKGDLGTQKIQATTRMSITMMTKAQGEDRVPDRLRVILK